jgi:hypothetical protein
MKYSVNMYIPGDTQAESWRNGLSKLQAQKVAKTWAAEHPSKQVYVSWHRESDGQTGYLNPDGEHAITGKAW